MKRVGIYVDVSNLYYTILNKYSERKLNYKAYWDFIEDLGDIKIATAYGAQMEDQAKQFIKKLRDIGYETKFKAPKEFMETHGRVTRKADWDVGVTVDIMNDAEDLDLIVIGSADSDFEPLVAYLKTIGKQVLIIATGISSELNNVADQCIEIPESLLEKKRQWKKKK